MNFSSAVGLQHPTELGVRNLNLSKDALIVNPLSAKYRPQSIQHSALGTPGEPPMSRAISKRSQKSSVDHVRRIRNNLPSSHSTKPSLDDIMNVPSRHLEAAGVNLDHYKMIKEQEKNARQKLIAARQENMLRYRPSNNALAAYSPLRHDISRGSHQSAAINYKDVVISKDELTSLRQIF